MAQTFILAFESLEQIFRVSCQGMGIGMWGPVGWQGLDMKLYSKTKSDKSNHAWYSS